MSTNSLNEQLTLINTIFSNAIEAKHDILPTPNITTPLLSHQTALVHSMYLHQMRMTHGTVYNSQIVHGKLGILGDPPGTGKTLSALSYISFLKSAPSANNYAGVRQGDLDDQSNRYFYSNHTFVASDISATHLIIVPIHLFSQWKNEIQRHTNLTHFAVENKRVLRNRSTAELMATSDFVLTTNRMYRYVHEFAAEHRLRWKHVFIDEAATIHLTANDPQLNFEFLWLISSAWLGFIFRNTWISPTNLLYIHESSQPLNSECMVWLQKMNNYNTNISTAITSSTFFKQYIPYGHNARSQLVLTCSPSLLNGSYSIPQLRNEVIECKQNYTLNSLRHMATDGFSSSEIPYIFESLNVGAYTLPEFLEDNESRKSLILTKMEDECAICIDTPTQRVLTTCCMNAFCGGCILRHIMLNTRCPTCRADISLDDLAYFPDLSGSGVSVALPCNRHDTCIKYISQHMGEPVIIFTIFENTYYQLLPELQRLGIESERLESSTANRVMNELNSNRVKVIFISNIDIIHGLNLTKIQHLIFFYEVAFYDQKELLISSAQRLGRLTPLTVIQLHSQQSQDQAHMD